MLSGRMRKLYTEPFYMAVSRSHELANRKKVTVDDLDDEQVLLLEDGHCLRDQALAVCSSHNAVENTNFRPHRDRKPLGKTVSGRARPWHVL